MAEKRIHRMRGGGMKYISTAELGDALENLKERKIVSYAELVSEIAALPAADVRPVVRGKWIQRKNWTRCVCSACSWEITFVTGNSYNFCPNCGADMRPTSMSGANGDGI